MATIDTLRRAIDALVATLTQHAIHPVALLLPFNPFGAVADALMQECLALAHQIDAHPPRNPDGDAAIDESPDRPDVADYQRQVQSLSVRVHRAIAIKLWLPAVLWIAGIVVVTLAALVVLQYFGVLAVIASWFNFPFLLQLMLLGLLGAGINLLAPPISKETGVAGELTLLKRFALAAVVPVVLVLILFDKDGKMKKFADEEGQLISFACGYSANVAFALLNKIVEKANAVIKAL